MLEVGKNYYFSKGRVKLANKKYNTCKSHLEIIMDVNSEVVPSEEKETKHANGENSPPTGPATAITPPPKAAPLATPTPRRTLTPVKAKSPGRLFQGRNVDSGIIKKGDWNKPDIGKASFTSIKRVAKKASLPITLTPGDEDRNGAATSKPLYDANLTDADRAKLRADRAAAAESRLKKLQGGNSNSLKKNSTRKRKSSATLVSPHSQPRMRWNLG